MKTDDFDYVLPPELIAQHPLPERAASRLLVVGDTVVSDQQFSELPQHLRAGDLLVMNDTKVIPARLYLSKASGGRVEVMLERMLDAQRLIALAKSNKPLRAGQDLFLDGQAVLRYEKRQGTFFVFQACPEINVEALFTEHGHIPLPPYITRSDSAQDQDRYQTIYAEKSGAVAAPTAGLHFDQRLLNQIKAMGVDTAQVTLHVGAGTFQPVKVDQVSEHVMHRERISVPPETIAKIQDTKQRGGRVIAVGTTTVRALESAAALSAGGSLQAYTGDTQLFIYPGYQFQVVDAMITNFHLPKSTLLMMISAFAGQSRVMRAYRHAIDKQYRFFSYGDAMLLTNQTSTEDKNDGI